jgi:hypothetical protein
MSQESDRLITDSDTSRHITRAIPRLPTRSGWHSRLISHGEGPARCRDGGVLGEPVLDRGAYLTRGLPGMPGGGAVLEDTCPVRWAGCAPSLVTAEAR